MFPDQLSFSSVYGEKLRAAVNWPNLDLIVYGRIVTLSEEEIADLKHFLSVHYR